jgi:hypothetical protein
MWGVVYLFTGGLFGIGCILDLVKLPELVREANARIALERANLQTPAQVSSRQASRLDCLLLHFMMALISLTIDIVYC